MSKRLKAGLKSQPQSPTLQALKAFCKHSWTVAWGYTKVAAGGILVSLHEVASYAGDIATSPEVKDAIKAVDFPAWVGVALAVIGVITLSARLHTANPVKMFNNEPVEDH